MNPYLLMSACLAAGLHGIENELEAPAPILGDAYADETLGRVPTSIEEAVDLFEQSEITNKYLAKILCGFMPTAVGSSRPVSARRLRAALCPKK